jgi:pimeloyl-ACP methyl ester carboxylesterase
MPATDEFDVDVGTHRLHAQRWGSATAPLVVGVPGLTGNIRNFAFLGERIGGTGMQLVSLDLRGRGGSDSTAPGTYGWENHARDVLAVADALRFDEVAIVGQSMGGSVAMKAAELDARRLRAVVLLDVAGRVDPGVGPVIAASINRLSAAYESVDYYVAAVRAQGLIEPWSDYWEGAYRYDVRARDGRVQVRTSLDAVAEDRAYTMTQDPYARWRHLAMPTLLVRATRELRPGAGYVVPEDDRDRFAREVPHAAIVEVDANHLTINTHPATGEAVARFLAVNPS